MHYPGHELQGELRRGLTSTPGSPAPISVIAGGTQVFDLAPGVQYAGDTYVLLGSLSGFAPGFMFGGFSIPLNMGPYFGMTVGSPASTPLTNSIGVLDAMGTAQSQFTPPGGTFPGLAGYEVYHAYIVLRVTPTLLEIAHVSNPDSAVF